MKDNGLGQHAQQTAAKKARDLYLADAEDKMKLGNADSADKSRKHAEDVARENSLV